MKKGILFLLTLLLTGGGLTTAAQDLGRLTDSLTYRAEMQATFSSGDHSPLWLNANRYGLSSVKCNYGYLRGALERPLAADSLRRWGIGYGVDVAVASGLTSKMVVQQAFAEARWLRGELTVGSKEQPMELKNQELSSGSQTLGINARPFPQVRLSLPDYWTVPYTRNWLAVKGHVAYGMQTDNGWQRDFVHEPNRQRYTENTLYHSKAGYLRIGPKNITLELGLEMGTQFGGDSHNARVYGVVQKNKSDLSAFMDALLGSLGSGADTGEAGVTGVYENADGNHVGSWVARLNLDYPAWALGLYADHLFEDHSGMFMLDYDGYGTGANWNKKEESRFFRYDLKDILLGLELKLKDFCWLNDIVVEYLYTKYQSSPVYHDHTQNISSHISGRDNYYNHNIFTGWQHWGMVIGNPLYLSPIYNDDGSIMVKNNRFKAWHFGLSGQPTARLHYRLLATTQKGFGTYYGLYPDPRRNFSFLAEAVYGLPKGWSVKGAIGWDSGEIYGDQTGVQLTVMKTGILRRRGL